MGLFNKISNGLKKTRDSMSGAIDSVLKSFGKIDDELYDELEEILIMSDVGVATSQNIISRLKDRVRDDHLTDPSEVKGALRAITERILSGHEELQVNTKPSVILMIGVNGAGKTTTIGKLALYLQKQGKKVILGAADTFRAAAIEQLEVWAERAGVQLIKHKEGADPAAVVFDTIAAGKARGEDVIICDTAGRLQNKKNLMDELAKISRIIERELPEADKEVLLVLDATTGQNAVSQAKLFSQAAGITGIVLTKLDGTARGGIVLSIRDELNIPVKFIGVGEGIDDLQPFNAKAFAAALFSEISDDMPEEPEEPEIEEEPEIDDGRPKFVLASQNAKKLEEMSRILAPMGYRVVTAASLGFNEDIEETGTSFEENSLIKASTVATALSLPAIADDSGLCVDALGGAPGIYSARYAGDGHDDKANNNKLLDELFDVPNRKRGAHYFCAVSVALPNGEHITVTGKCEGSIGHNPKGDNGFGYDPIFKVGMKTMAQLTDEQKDSISHRGNALRELKKVLPEFMEKYNDQ